MGSWRLPLGHIARTESSVECWVFYAYTNQPNYLMIEQEITINMKKDHFGRDVAQSR